MNSPRFLRPPDPPRVSQHPANQPITQAQLVDLWRRVGVIQRAQRDTRISRADFYGLLSLVTALAFAMGYYLAS